jgi:hypothetical protein
MPWDLKDNRIAAVKYMHPKIQRKATLIANAIMREGNADEGQAIAIGIKKAKEMFEKQAMIQSGLRTDIPSVFSGKQIGTRNDIPLAKGLPKPKGLIKLATENLSLKDLQEYRIEMTKAELDEVFKKKAVWHHGPNGEETPAIWKSLDVHGAIKRAGNHKTPKAEFLYVTNTHRALRTARTLDKAIKLYHRFIKRTA